LLGAILENIKSKVDTKKLKGSLKQLKTIKLGLKVTVLPTFNNWYIE
jgi:hypothetical protein